MRFFRYILVLFPLLFFGESRAQLPYFTHYNTLQGLAGNQCYDLLQDRWGFVWMATSAGISRFDGTFFQNFTVDNGLQDNETLKIFEDSSGKIWFLTLNGSVGFIKGNEVFMGYNHPVLAKISSKSVGNFIFEDSHKRVWISFSDGRIFSIQQEEVKQYIEPKLNDAVLYQNENGEIIAENTRHTFVLRNKGFEPIILNDSVKNFQAITTVNHNESVLLDSAGTLFRTKDKRLGSVFTISNFDGNIESKIFYTPTNVREFGIWMAQKRGVHFYSKNYQTLFFLSNVKVNKVIRALDKNYWFATSDGVFLLPNIEERYFIFSKEENGLWSDHVCGVYNDAQNRRWLGYKEGVVDVFKDKVLLKRFKLFGDRESSEIKQFCFDEFTDRLFVVTDFGLFYFSGISKGEITQHQVDLTALGKFALKRMSISNQYIAIATSSGVYLLQKNKFKNNKFTLESLVYNHSGRSFEVFLDGSEHLWFSNLDGFSEYADGKLTNHFAENALLSRRINDIKMYKDNIKILATDGNGVLFYQNGKVIHQLNQLNGLSSNICQKVFVKNDTIWIQTARGCNYIIQKNGQYAIRSLNYIHAEISDKLTDIFINKNNNSGYLASDKGLIVFVNYLKTTYQPVPIVYIRSVRINGDNKIFTKSIKLKSFKTNVTVQFGAISYNNASVGYRYKLNENNWVETNATKIEYVTLLPGKYKLLISANKNNGEWSKPATVNFEIEAPFWWQWWFITLVLLLFVGLMYVVFRWVTSIQKEREKNELRAQNKILALEQQALQAMMNPHFVFNVMNAIQHFINTKDNEGANRMLTGFARLIRKNLDICTKSKISIQEEIQYLELYLKLEKLRFGDKLKYFIEIEKGLDIEDIMIPTMLLQPFVENSVWHGLLPKAEGGEIRICLHMDTQKRRLQIQIIDNGVGINNSMKNKKSTHVSKGMSITKERIFLMEQIDKKHIHLDMRQTGESGTLVVLTFPV